MPLVFKTDPDWPSDVWINGVGVLRPHGQNAIAVSDAADVMTELQEKDELGRVKTDEAGAPVHLSGAQLTAAAKKWADTQQALVAANVKDAELETLTAPDVPDRPPADEVGADEYARFYEGLETANTPGGPQGYVIPPPGLAEPVDIPLPAPTHPAAAPADAAGSLSPQTESKEGGQS
jgi:hypothetical protein